MLFFSRCWIAFSEAGDPADSNWKVGMLFSVVGIGCLVGPLLAEPYLDIERPTTVQLAIVLAFGLSTIGYFGWSFKFSFVWICLVALVRSAGSSIIWINSTLLLQKFSSPDMLGRVLAADYALALSAEAFSAYMCGILMDVGNLSAYQVSSVLAVVTAVQTILWSYYHLSGRGAGKYRKPKLESQTSSSEFETIITP